MRVAVAFDKFKDSLSASEACAIAAAELQARHPEWILDLCPLTDGGEGFGEILTTTAGGTWEKISVTGPRGAPVEAFIGWVAVEKIPPAARALLGIETLNCGWSALTPLGGDRSSEVRAVHPHLDPKIPRHGTIAVLEMASASGLALLPIGERDPWQTSSVGTGQLIRHAAARGASLILLGVGGSATHDLGLGALQSLGLNFLSADHAPIAFPCPDRWPEIVRLDGQISPTLPPIRLACDVTNPLLGPRGAATVFGPQKGLRPADLPRLEHASARLALMLTAHCAQSDALMDVPGAGAAGGIAFGLMTAAGAQLSAGSDLVAAWLNLEARLNAADLVLTGEGRFDASSLTGKGPGALATRALTLGKSVHVFAGSLGDDLAPETCHVLRDMSSGKTGLQLHAIAPAKASLEEALRAARENLAAAVRAVF